MPLALKEWDAVCEALGSGRQVVVIHRGDNPMSVAESSGQGADFLLLPAFFHQQAERVVPEACFSAPRDDGSGDHGPLEIRYAATLIWSKVVTDRATLARLQDFHILSAEEVETRFTQTSVPCAQVALLRVYRLDPPQCVPWWNSFGEDGAWAEMEANLLETCTRVSVLSDERFAKLERDLLAILG